MRNTFLQLFLLFFAGVLVFGVLSSCDEEDTIDPTLTLNGQSHYDVVLNTSFTDPGVVATDTQAGDLNDAVTVDGAVNTDLAGTYTLTYSVEDDGGNTASATRTVTVYNEAKTLAGTYEVVYAQYPGGAPQTLDNVAVAADEATNRQLNFENFAGQGITVSGLWESIASGPDRITNLQASSGSIERLKAERANTKITFEVTLDGQEYHAVYSKK